MTFKFEDVVAELVKSKNQQAGAWQTVIRRAREYAQMKAHGTYLHHGAACVVSSSDRKTYEEQYLSELLYAIELAYAEDARMGAKISRLT